MADQHYVHNHGPEEGRGLNCPEYVIEERRYGYCILSMYPEMARQLTQANVEVLNLVNEIIELKAERDRWKDRWAATVRDADEQRHKNAELWERLAESTNAEKPRVRVFVLPADAEFTD